MVDVKLRWSTAWLVVLAGCSRCNEEECHGGECVTNLDGSSSSSDGSADDSASTSSQASSEDDDNATTEGSSTGDDGQCHGTDECAASEFCVAPYADNVRGAFACVSECVGPLDEAVWCYDDAACCDAAASCTIRGYCEVMTATSDSSSSGDSSDSGSSSDTGTGSDSGSTG